MWNVRSHPLIAAGPRRSLVVERIEEILDYLFGLLYALLLVRFALEFFNARPGAGFVRLIRDVTDPFYAPFQSIVASNSIEGARVVWPLIIAIVGYLLLHAAIRGVLRLVARE
jgi:uncharacterized protein YggT (Ycf19 family)